MVVEMSGWPDMLKIIKIAKKYNLKLYLIMLNLLDQHIKINIQYFQI